jgi:hypothetical protein
VNGGGFSAAGSIEGKGNASGKLLKKKVNQAPMLVPDASRLAFHANRARGSRDA